MADVAVLAGVSGQTVSRVVNGTGTVGPETTARVQAALAELGYRPHRAARALRTGRSNALGVVVTTLESVGNSLMLQAIARAAAEEEFTISLVTLTETTESGMQTALGHLVEQAVDGAIIVNEASAFASGPTPMPVVLIDAPEQSPHAVVRSDHRAGGAHATRLVLRDGTVHHVAGPATSIAAREREAGWRAALTSEQREIPEPLRGDWTAASGYDAGRTLAHNGTVRAVFCANDQMALGVMRALHETGRKIPEDVAVIGFDGIADAAHWSPPLSTMAQDFSGLATAAIAALAGTAPSHTVLPVRPVLRDSTPRRIVVAPDSFKGSISAHGAASAIADGWLEKFPNDVIATVPMADGGEGTIAAFVSAYPDAVLHTTRVLGPDNVQHDAEWLMLPDGTAVVELGATSGIELLGNRRLPMTAHTIGFGQAIAAALDAGASALVLGIGSSASTDGGAGMLHALGATGIVPGDLAASDPDLSTLRPVPGGGVVVLTDVTNPLLGEHGAARVFGPQKGANAHQIGELEIALERWAVNVSRQRSIDPATPGAGAAGGTGFALLAWGASLEAGAQTIATLVGLDAAMIGAQLVITGEGSYDAQSAAGKVPAEVQRVAEAHGVPVAIVAGRITADTTELAGAQSLTDLAGSAAEAMQHPVPALHAAGRNLATQLG